MMMTISIFFKSYFNTAVARWLKFIGGCQEGRPAKIALLLHRSPIFQVQIFK